MYSTDFVGALPATSDLFYAKTHHHLVVPLSMVFKEVVSAKAQIVAQNQRSNPTPRSAPGKVGDHRNAQEEDIDVRNPTALARDLGMTKRQFFKEQEQVLKEGEIAKHAEATAKKSESYEEVKDAMHGESITANDQQLILDRIKREKENREGGHGGKLTPPQTRSPKDPSKQDSNQPLMKQRSWQEQGHVYERIPGDSPNAKRRLAQQRKAASEDLLQDSHGQYYDQHSGTLQPQYPDQFQGNQQYPIGGQQQWTEHDNLHRGVNQPPPGDQHAPQQMQRMTSTPQLQYEGFSAITGLPSDDLPPAIALGFEIGSTIQIQSVDPTQPQRYGVIRWIGTLPSLKGQVAGIELVSLN